MRKILAFGLVFLLLGSIGGCRNLECPNWMHPGSAQEQQRRAIRYDPYPQTDMGGSTTNVRPQNYQTPMAEPSRARWFLNGW